MSSLNPAAPAFVPSSSPPSTEFDWEVRQRRETKTMKLRRARKRRIASQGRACHGSLASPPLAFHLNSQFARGCRGDPAGIMSLECSQRRELHARPGKQQHANKLVRMPLLIRLVARRFSASSAFSSHDSRLPSLTFFLFPPTTKKLQNSPSPRPPRKRRSSTPATRGSPRSSTPRSPTSSRRRCTSRRTTL